MPVEYLPINLNIKNKQCLVVGGGNIALRKAKQLFGAGGKLTIVAPKFHPDFVSLSSSESLELITAEYHPDLLQNKLLVIAATDDSKINQAVFSDAENKGVMVNVVDQPELCRFIMPSVINRSPLTIAISSGGTAPVLARMLREKIEWMLPSNIGSFLSKVKSQRKIVAERYPELNARRKFWESFFEDKLGWSTKDNLKDTGPEELELEYVLDFSAGPETPNCVAIVDLGKGQLHDLTVRTLDLLQKADDIHLSEKNYQWLKNIIRRDANLHFADDQAINFEYLNGLSIQQSKMTIKDGSKTVVLRSGHGFETDKQAYAQLFEKVAGCTYLRIGAINERCPL